jgi:hypothetical protein
MPDIVVMKRSSLWQIRRGPLVTAEFSGQDSAVDAACEIAKQLGGTVSVFEENVGFQRAYSFPSKGAQPS